MTTAGAVIATFNQEEFIAESVLSLADQVDEIVVVDDCSTDGTWDVLQSLGHPRVRALRNSVQSGVSATYNRAVAEVSAEILIIQGGDDRALSDRVERQIDALSDPEVSLSYSLPVVIDGRGRRLPDLAAAEFFIDVPLDDPLGFLYLRSNFVCAPSAAVRTESYRRHGGFRRGLDLLQDFDLWLELAAEGRFALLDSPVVEYRKHGMNLSREYVRLDAPKQRRMLAEREFSLHRFIRASSDETLLALARSCSLPQADFAALDREQREALIELSHPDRLIIRRGLSALFAILGGDDGVERLARMGLTARDVSTFATLADHGNSGDVAQALAAARGSGSTDH